MVPRGFWPFAPPVVSCAWNLQNFEQESGHRQNDYGPEVGIVILFFKNLSRSRATGNLQATLNGTFFWEILILSRSLATGKLQATLKLICYLFLNRFFSNFKNLSRSRAKGNLQATLNGTFFFGEILILSRSLPTGKLQATLKLIC